MLDLQVGNQFVQDNRTLEVFGVSGHEVVFKQKAAENTYFDVMKVAELYDHLKTGSIRPKIKSLPAPIVLKPAEEARFKKISPYLLVMQEFESQQLPPTTQLAYEQVLRIIEARHPRVSFAHPSRSALAKYFKKLTRDKDMKSLFVRRGHGGKSIAPWQVQILDDSIQHHWIEARSENKLGAYRRYWYDCMEKNQQPVSRSTYFRRINELTVLEKNHLHSDKAGRINLIGSNVRSIMTHALLSRVEIDRCVLNLSVFDGDVPTDSIAVYAAIDVHSRVLLGLTITYNQAEDTDGVMQLLHQLHLNRPELPYTGKIDTIFRDNGPGFRAHAVTDALESLGITVINTPPYQAKAKPYIESFFKTMANFLMDGFFYVGSKEYQGVPGYLGVIPKRSGIKCSRATKDKATLTRAAFEKIMHDLVLYYNNEWPHSEIRMTPNEKWEEQIALSPVIPIEYQDVKKCFHYVEKTATLQKENKLTLLNQTFSSDKDTDLYNRLRISNDGQNPQVVIRYNPFDATSISVYETKEQNGKCYVFHNAKLKDLNTPRSFNEIQRKPLKSATLFRVNISAADEHIPEKTKPTPHNNKRVSSYDEDRKQDRDTQGIIQKSHQEYKEHRKQSSKKDNSSDEQAQGQDNRTNNHNLHQPFDEGENW